MQWTIRNIGSGPVIVRATYLEPGETRDVTEPEARSLALARPNEIAIVNPPGALEPGITAETSGNGSGEPLPPAETSGNGSGEPLPPADNTDSPPEPSPAPVKTAPIAPAKRTR